MAKVDKNLVIQGLSGSLADQLVIQHGKGGQTIIRSMPRRAEREQTPAQREQVEKFRAASAYAQSAAADPALRERYEALAEGTPKTARNVAMADFLHDPEVPEADLDGWTGAAGQPIRVKAVDDVQVAAVFVTVAGEGGAVVETGGAARDPRDPLWWAYTTTAITDAEHAVVIATARDLAGRTGRREARKSKKSGN